MNQGQCLPWSGQWSARHDSCFLIAVDTNLYTYLVVGGDEAPHVVQAQGRVLQPQVGQVCRCLVTH